MTPLEICKDVKLQSGMIEIAPICWQKYAADNIVPLAEAHETLHELFIEMFEDLINDIDLSIHTLDSGDWYQKAFEYHRDNKP